MKTDLRLSVLSITLDTNCYNCFLNLNLIFSFPYAVCPISKVVFMVLTYHLSSFSYQWRFYDCP